MVTPLPESLDHGYHGYLYFPVSPVDGLYPTIKMAGISPILILNNHSIFSKFLHHGCSASADIIVVCVDNDRRPVKEGVGEDIITQISVFYEEFLEKNTFYQNPPCLVCAVPVSTIDYWMKAISERNTDCNEILPAINIPIERIKEETYGKKCVFRGTFIDEGAIERKVKEIRKDGSLEKLRCLPSFQDFEKYLKGCFEKRLSSG